MSNVIDYTEVSVKNRQGCERFYVLLFDRFNPEFFLFIPLIDIFRCNEEANSDRDVVFCCI